MGAPLPESRISAVVLTYRKAWIFSRFLASLKRQSRPPDEVVVVDDASDDGTLRALDTLPSSYGLVRLTVNRGQSFARNVGIRESTGDLIAFLDADIDMADNMLQSLETTLRTTPGASFSYSHYLRAGTLRGEQRARPWDVEALRKRNYVSVMSLVRRDHLPIPAFDESLRSLEDWDLWLTMADQGRSGVLVDECLFSAFYRKCDVTPSAGQEAVVEAIRLKHGLTAKAGTP